MNLSIFTAIRCNGLITKVIKHDENYTSLVVSLLVHKMGGAEGGGRLFQILADRRGAYSKRALITGEGRGRYVEDLR